MTEIVQASSDAEFLALVPRIAGFRPRNSLVVVLFSGRRTRSAFRVDLPRRDRTAELRRIAEFVVTTARRIPGVDRIAPIVYTDAPLAGHRAIPRRALVSAIERRAGREDLEIAGAFCVAGDGWGPYADDRRVEPRPLAEIAPGALADAPELDTGELPRAGELDLRAFDASWRSVLLEGDLPDPATHLEHCLATDPDSRDLARLGVLLQDDALRDALMLQAAFGSIAGEVVAERNARLSALRAERGCSMDDVVLAEIAAGRLDPDDEIDGLLLGRGRLRPDAERIERMRELLGALSVRLVERRVLNPLCMLVWLSWSVGHGTAAGHYLDLARSIDPRHGMTEVLGTLLDRVPFPEWAIPPAEVPHD